VTIVLRKRCRSYGVLKHLLLVIVEMNGSHCKTYPCPSMCYEDQYETNDGGVSVAMVRVANDRAETGNTMAQQQQGSVVNAGRVVNEEISQ
jgi:hypothetical protein